MLLLLLACNGDGNGPLGNLGNKDGCDEEELFYTDRDGDGFGTDEVWSCERPSGTALKPGDCDDLRSSVHPDAEERCATERDDNCDGNVDDGDDGDVYYLDADGDGFGDEEFVSCSWPEGYATLDGDCDDDNPDVNPRVDEVCNETDDDCDGAVDEFVGGFYYTDEDGDGYGTGSALDLCDPPEGVADRGGDCDDTNPVLTERGIYFDDALVEFDNGDTYTLPGDGDVTICKGTWNIRLVADGVTATISGVEGAATTNLSGGVEATPLTILDSTVTVEGLTILDGDSDGDGGCVYVDGSVASFTDVTVRNCEAVNGGAVYLTGSTVSMSNGGFRDNSVTGNGGSVFVEHGPLTLSNVIQSQSDAGSGGAVYVGEDGSVLASGGEVHDCEAADGGGIAVVGGTWSSSQTTIRANQAQANGGGFYVEDGDVTLVGGKLAANSGGEGGGVYVASGGGLVTTETDCAQGTSDNAPNDAKPAFGDAVSWDGTCTAVCDDSLCE